MDNLIRLSDIINCEAKERATVKRYDCEDVFLTHYGSISGMTVSGQGILGFKRYVPSQSFERISRNLILVKKVNKLRKKKEKSKSVFSFRELKGKNVITEAGEYTGRLSDMYYNIEKGKVVAVEVARSLFEDFFTGRMLIPGSIVSFDRSSVIVSTVQLENSLHNTKGIINVIDTALN